MSRPKEHASGAGRPLTTRAHLAFIAPELRALDDAPGDLLIVTAFADERPLEGLTGLVDWRLSGALSRWRIGGFSTGYLGERVLYPTWRRLSHPLLLFVGLGSREEYRPDRAFAVAEATREAVAGLGAERITSGFFGLDRLPSPLERTALKLVEVLTAGPEVRRLTLVADPRAEGLVRDGMHIFGSSPD